MLRFLAFLLGLILGFNGSGSEHVTPDRGQDLQSGPKTALTAPSAMPIGGPEAEVRELRFLSFEVERGRELLHKA